MKALYRKRLLNVARALRESRNPDEFTMEKTHHECGTPACAIGHYAARRDLQREFTLKSALGSTDGDGEWAYAAQRHFGLEGLATVELLFGSKGCGGAETPKAAARYIERFVARKKKEAKR